MKSKLLVFSQFFIIFLMILPVGAQTDTLYLGLFVSLLGGVVGMLALSQNRVGNFNIRPDIKENCTLIKTGIYAYIRHPMYSSVLLGMLGVVIIYPTIYEYVLFCLLTTTLLIKLFYEESLWKCESQEYVDYVKHTKRVIPFLF